MGNTVRTLIYIFSLATALFIAVLCVNKVDGSTNDTIFIQIWLKRTELEKLKKCDINSHVRVERPNDEYYILPCKAVRGLQ